jgi:class III poly(R)-hydroxyalkanoic acid synthase PhaE subunit
MNWSEPMQNMMEGWAQAQRAAVEGWAEAAQKVTGEEASSGDWLEAWRRMAEQSSQSWAHNLSGLPKSVAERMAAADRAYRQFAEVFFGAMKEIAPRVQGGTDWVKAFSQYLEGLKRAGGGMEWSVPQAATSIAQDLGELWKLYLAQVQAVGMPWVESLREAGGHVGEAMAGDRRAFIRMANLFTDTFESTLGRFLAAPAIGYTREFQEKATKAAEAYGDMKRAEAAYTAELVNIGYRALEALAKEAAAKGGSGEPITSYRELFDLWVNVAETTYFEAASSPSFADVQARLVNASMHYRVHERVLADIFARALHLPTRTEIDDAYRHLHEVSREVKRLRREVDALHKRLAEQPAVQPPEAALPQAPAAPSPPDADLAPRARRPRDVTRLKKAGTKAPVKKKKG